MHPRQAPPYQQQMYMQQSTPFPHQMMMGMNQMPPKRQGLLSKLFKSKNQNPQEMYYMMNEQAGFTPMMMPNSQHHYTNQQPQMNYSHVRMMNPQTATATATASRGATSGIGSFFSNILSNPSSMIGNMEKIVQVAQTVGPMVQQYGPIVKNFPSIVKLFSSINSSDTKETSEETAADEINTEPKQQKKSTATPLKEQPSPEGKQPEHTQSTANTNTQQSSRTTGPKLYV